MTDPNDPFHRLTPLDQSTLKLPWEAATAVLEATWRFLLGSGDVSVLSTKHQQTVIVAALVRRAVVITEGIFRLLRGGLIEPAFGLYRTLLEIHFTLKLVLEDDTSKMALRLLGYDCYQRHLYGEKQLRNPLTREVLENSIGEKKNVAAKAKSWRLTLEDPAFDTVREELLADIKNQKGWHGKGQRIGDAAKAAGMEEEYVRTYGLASLYVHADNVAWDFDEQSEGKPMLKAFVHEDTGDIVGTLGKVTVELLFILLLVVDYRKPDLIRDGKLGPVADQLTALTNFVNDAFRGVVAKPLA
jgi:hypothetical protein